MTIRQLINWSDFIETGIDNIVMILIWHNANKLQQIVVWPVFTHLCAYHPGKGKAGDLQYPQCLILIIYDQSIPLHNLVFVFNEVIFPLKCTCLRHRQVFVLRTWWKFPVRIMYNDIYMYTCYFCIFLLSSHFYVYIITMQLHCVFRIHLSSLLHSGLC